MSHHDRPRMTNPGPRYMAISALAFALMGSLVKLAGEMGVPLLQIIFVRAVISVVLSLWDLRRYSGDPLGNRRGLLLARGLSGFLALMGVFYALMHLPLAQATMLQYLHPVFTALLAFIFLWERPSAATVSCVLLSLIGLGCMVSPYWVSAEGIRFIAFGCVGRFRGRFWQWRCVYVGAQAGRHRAPQCDRVVFPPCVYSRYVVVGLRAVHLANSSRVADISGYWLPHPAWTSGPDQSDAVGFSQSRNKPQLHTNLICCGVGLGLLC